MSLKETKKQVKQFIKNKYKGIIQYANLYGNFIVECFDSETEISRILYSYCDMKYLRNGKIKALNYEKITEYFDGCKRYSLVSIKEYKKAKKLFLRQTKELLKSELKTFQGRPQK